MNNSLILTSIVSDSDNRLGHEKRERHSHSVKKTRKQIEADAQALSNRIALLHREEEKIWKNLEIAKIKARDIVNLKKRDAEKTRERQMYYQQQLQQQQQEESVSSVPFGSALIRRQRDTSIQQLKQALQSYKHHEMLTVRRQAEVNKVKRQDMESQILQEKQARMVVVKKQEILAGFKKRAFFNDKMTRIKAEQLKRQDDEEEIKISKELEILNMEKKEMELVNRIQNTKHLQKQVYGELEAIISNSSEGGFRPRKNIRSHAGTRSQSNIRDRTSGTETPLMYQENRGGYSIIGSQVHGANSYRQSDRGGSYDPIISMRV